MPDIRHKRGTKAALDALAADSDLIVGQIYVLTDERRIAVAMSETEYVEFARLDELELAPTPEFTISRILIEGDSITSTTPNQSTQRGDFYSYAWADANPAFTVSVPAQASRTVGGAAGNGDQADNGTPTGNTLLAHVADDLAFAPDLVTTKIGANDFQNTSPATYKARLKVWADQIRTATRRIAYSPPTPYRATNPHANYAAYTANRNAFMGEARNPAVWGEWADYYIPMGEHPAFKDSANDAVLYGDTVHVSSPATTPTTGQGKLLEIYAAAMRSLTDQARASATSPYEDVWPVSQINLPANSQLTRRFIVAGIAHAGLALGAEATGAELRLNGGAWGASIGTDSGNGFRLYNGDVIDMRFTTSAAADTAVPVTLRLGGETRELTYRTVAQVDTAVYQHGNVVNLAAQAAVHNYGPRAFEQGLAVIAVNGSGYRAANSVPISVTVDGVDADPERQVLSDSGVSLWTVPIDEAGDKTVIVTFSAFKGQSTISWGTVTGADPTPVQVSPANNRTGPASNSAPHLTDELTIPASGIAVAFFGEYGGATITPATANAPTMLVDRGGGTFQSETLGLAVATQTESDQASFDFAFGAFLPLALVFKAAGT